MGQTMDLRSTNRPAHPPNIKDIMFEAQSWVRSGGGRVFRVRKGVRRAKNVMDMESVPAWETAHPTRTKTHLGDNGLEAPGMV
jgi:hypothetical protein